MASEPKVSVVMPVYNTAAYLRQCLDSVVNQTLQDIEIICVDDGSTDNSLAILEEYAASDSRVRILQQQNQYAGVARNNGMAQARGEYIMFCDSDDYIALDALEKMYSECKRTDSDICVCAGERYYEHLDMSVASPGYLEVKRIPEGVPFNRHSNADHIFDFTTIMMFNKMFRLSFLRENDLKYDTTRNGEDVCISALALWLAKAITVVKTPLVFYRIDRPDSLVGTLSESAVDPLRAWTRVWGKIGDELGASERCFICKVIGVLRHSFRNVSTAEAFFACYRFAKDDMVAKMGIRERENGYYNASWYNVFVRHLLADSETDFMAFVLYTVSRELEAEEAKKLNYRQRLRRAKSAVKKAKENARSSQEEVERVKGSRAYRLGSGLLKPYRALRKAMRG